ncbi:MAG: hypothetical protein CW742_05650 [Methanoregula sp.]|nr:MAG: hypothetical protein CW742_05650 [Methanoregula sp.]
MMIPEASWPRTWRIIRRVQRNEIPQTPGYQKYLQQEIRRMSPEQYARFIQETTGNTTGDAHGVSQSGLRAIIPL